MALAGSLCSEVVEARVHEGLHFRCSGQTVCFGDSPQVCCRSLTAPPVSDTHQTGQTALLLGVADHKSSRSLTDVKEGHSAINRWKQHL